MIIINNDFNVEKQTFYHHFNIIETASISSWGGDTTSKTHPAETAAWVLLKHCLVI